MFSSGDSSKPGNILNLFVLYIEKEEKEVSDEEDPYEAFMREIDVCFIHDIYFLERNKARCNGILTKR